MDQNKIKKIIDASIQSYANFRNRKLGDTPTDDIQLANKKYVDSKLVYSGTVNSNGTTVYLPTGWTSSNVATGQYRITHNLGSTNYAVTAMVVGTVAAFCQTDSLGSNSFDLFIFKFDGTQRDDKFSFLLAQKP